MHEELIQRALETITVVETLDGYGNHVAALRKAILTVRAETEWLAANESNPSLNRFVTGKQIAVKTAVGKIEDTLRTIEVKRAKDMEREAEREVETSRYSATGHSAAIGQQAAALVELVANSEIDSVPDDLLAFACPDLHASYFQSRGGWYRRGPGGTLEQAVEEEVAEQVHQACAERNIARIVGAAHAIARQDEDVPIDVAPVLRTWESHLKTYKNLYTHLPSDESVEIRDDLLPVVLDGASKILHRKTGKLTDEPPAGVNVLYPAVTAATHGESRALDALVAHHFKTEEERSAFYQLCGISLFGYGIPNLVFLLGKGGSGKDALFSLMRAVHGDRHVCTVNAAALMSHDESNDLVRLQTARFALCSFESSHQFDGAFKPAVLKSITSGGQNPITARAKYAKTAVDIYYRGSLWLYGNRVPNLTGGGDFDGLDRRFTILPMVRKLPTDAPPPSGFATWPDAVVACAPVFAERCLSAFMAWHAGGAVGYSDVRKRVPAEWRAMSNEHLMAGSRFGFLRDLFMPSETGLRETTVFEVMSAVFKQEGIKVGRSRFLGILKDTISDSARFEGGRHMESEDRGGQRHLPLTVVPSTLHRLLDALHVIDALHALRNDGGWDPDMVEIAHKWNTEAQLRAKLYEGDDE